ncbi:MAG: sugar transporter [Bacteroidia bacterium]|nr:sugar transporter [Bacteroidia bacterium]
MKKLALLFSLSILFLSVYESAAQIPSPVHWEFSVAEVDGDEATLLFKANIDKGWHLYSQHVDPMGPIPTEFTFKESKEFSLIGDVTEDENDGETVYDPNFEMELTYFSNQAFFYQKVKLNYLGSFKIAGDVGFMVCDDKRCLPPEYVDFNIIYPVIEKDDK